MDNAHKYIDEFKLRLAKAVLDTVDLKCIRQVSLDNLSRWRCNGVWCSAYEEWSEIMRNAPNETVIALMTDRDENANRLRQSAPYVGIVSEVTRYYLWETRAIENDSEAIAAYFAIDKKRLRLAKDLLDRFGILSIKKRSLDYLERLESVVGEINVTHQQWRDLLRFGRDDEIIAVINGSDERAINMRLVHPFNDMI